MGFLDDDTFLDEIDPEVLFERRLLAYVDVLGWSELVRSPRGDEVVRKIFAATSRLESALEAEADRKTEFAELAVPFGKTIRVSYFSDTLVYSCEPTPDEAAWMVGQVQRVCASLMSKGHYVRGGITIGELQHDGNTTVGRALVDAYDIDRKVARYPRLIVTKEAEPLMLGSRVNIAMPFGPSQVRVDFDGLTFLDFFRVEGDGKRSERNHKFALAAKAAVQADLVRAKVSNKIETLNHRAKYEWLLRYLETILVAPVRPSRAGEIAALVHEQRAKADSETSDSDPQ